MELKKINESFESETKFESDFYKLKEGSNKMRILTDFVKVETIWNNQRYKGFNHEGRKLDEGDMVRKQAWAWAYIVESKELKIVQFSKTVTNHLVQLLNDPDYSFESFPMPYDIDIKTKNAGTKEVDYSITPARVNTEVSNEVMSALNKKKQIKDIIDAIIAKQLEKSEEKIDGSKIEYPKEEINPSDIPF